MDLHKEAIVELFRKNNYELFVVGGYVRDYVMGKKAHDIDFATNAKPDEMKKMCDEAGIRYMTAGEKHGTVTLIMDGQCYEVTTYRVDEVCDGRHAEVAFTGSLIEDLGRRDLTMNAMAMDPQTLTIIDPYGGCQDIERGVIRTVGEPRLRFTEDALRVVRALRFAVRYGMRIEEETRKEIQRFIQDGLIDRLAMERIHSELMGIFGAERLGEDEMELLRPLLFHLFPELARQYGYDQNSKYHKFDLWTHTVKTVVGIDKFAHKQVNDHELALLRMAALLHDVGKPQSRSEDGVYSHYIGHGEVGASIVIEDMKRLKFSRDEVELVSHLIRLHDEMFKGSSKRSVRKLIRKVGLENMDMFFVLRQADAHAHGLKNNEVMEHIIQGMQTYDMLRHEPEIIEKKNIENRVVLNGTDVMEILGIDPGPMVGKVLQYLQECVDEGIIENEYKELVVILQAKYL